MKALARFKKGNTVQISCYKDGCEGISMPVTLGVEYALHPFFVHGRGVGRLRWQSNAAARGFELSQNFGGSSFCRCSKCGTQFGSVVVISNGKGRKATVFGYDPGCA